MATIPSITMLSGRPPHSILILPGLTGYLEGEFQFNRLDLWPEYTALKNKWALSAYLGWNLHLRINSIVLLIDDLPPSSDDGPAIDWEDIRDSANQALDIAQRSWDDLMETNLALVTLLNALGVLEDFTPPITPITVQTMQLIVGDESLQFRLILNRINKLPKDLNLVYNKVNKQVTANPVVLQHMTLGIDTLSSNYDGEDYLFWDIGNFVSQRLLDDKMYYLYARCAKAGTSGNFKLIDDHYQMDRGDGYYYFLVGILNSVVNEERSFAEMYGFTEILPGRITVKKIVSADGLTYFDLENGEIGGNISIGSFIIENNILKSFDKNEITNEPNFSVDSVTGKLIAKDADIKGHINATSGTFSGAVSSPFERATISYSEDFSNNLIVTGFSFQLPWDEKGSGRLIRLIQPDRGTPTCTAPTGKYFYENGEQKSTLEMTGAEIVELLGYTDKTGEFQGWLVLNRGLLNTNSTWGEPQRIIASGRVQADRQFKHHTFDGSLMTLSFDVQESEFYANIKMSPEWFSNLDGYYVRVIGGSGYNAAFHVVTKLDNSNFTISQFKIDASGGSLTREDTFDFYFEVYSAAWFYRKDSTDGGMVDDW